MIDLEVLPTLSLCLFFFFSFLTFNFLVAEIVVFLISFNISKTSTIVTPDGIEIHKYRV